MSDVAPFESSSILVPAPDVNIFAGDLAEFNWADYEQRQEMIDAALTDKKNIAELVSRCMGKILQRVFG